MKAPALVLVLSLDGDTGTAPPGWEAPGEGLPLAGCGRSYFPGDPVVGSAYHCPGCTGLGAPGPGTLGEWLQPLQGATSCGYLFIYGFAFAHRAQLNALPRGNVWSVFAHSPGNPSLNLQAPSWLASLPDTLLLLLRYVFLPAYIGLLCSSSKMHSREGTAGPGLRAGLYRGRGGVAISGI